MNLEGLTARQKAIAEILWSEISFNEVKELERILGVDVTIVKDLMIAAALDEYMEVSKDTQEFLKKFR